MLMVLSTASTTSLEDVATAQTPAGNLWFQLYVFKDRNLSASLVKRAERAGFKALVVTVDTPIVGHRLIDMKNKFTLPSNLKLANFEGSKQENMADMEVPSDFNASRLHYYIGKNLDQALVWDDIAWLQSVTSLPIFVKGILTGEDSERAILHGASGIIVSNHGGRQLDSVPSTIMALPGVVKSVKGRVPVIVDGGIRRGTDVFKALALGANMVLIGRPVVYGLTVGGEKGLNHVVDILDTELQRTMALAGCPTLKTINRSLVRHRQEFISHL